MIAEGFFSIITNLKIRIFKYCAISYRQLTQKDITGTLYYFEERLAGRNL